MTTHSPVILDIAGPALDANDRRRLAHPMTGGLILFGRHWQSRGQITQLVAEIKSIRPDLLVCVDHEGGRVQRFRTDGFTHLPPMRFYGDMWMNDAMQATVGSFYPILLLSGILWPVEGMPYYFQAITWYVSA